MSEKFEEAMSGFDKVLAQLDRIQSNVSGVKETLFLTWAAVIFVGVIAFVVFA